MWIYGVLKGRARVLLGISLSLDVSGSRGGVEGVRVYL